VPRPEVGIFRHISTNSSTGQIKWELKLFYTEERKKWAKPKLSFIERNSKGLFLYKRFPKEEIENINNAAQDHI